MRGLKFKITFKILFILALAPLTTLVAQVEKNKKVNRTFEVESNSLLSISNKYGDVHINTWDKNVIELKITITAKKRNERTAQDYLDKVEIDITESSNHIQIETEISGNINNGNGEKLSIDYLVSMPKSNDLELKHSYGSLFLGDLTGDVELKMSYGNMTVQDLTGDSEVKLSYGNGEIAKMKSGSLSIGYSNLSVDDIGSVDLSCQYSNVDLTKTKDIELSNKYGSLEIEEINNLKGSSRYGSLEIDKLFNSLILDLVYGNGVKVDWISKNFNRIDLDITHSSGTSLRFERGFSAELDAQFRYSDLKYSESDFDFSYVQKESTRNEYKGRIGEGTGDSKIRLESSYGSVKMGYSSSRN